MTTSDLFTFVTLVVASISMLLSCIALWPQSRQTLSFVRDVVLWTTLVFVFVGMATLGWRHFRVNYRPRLQPQSTAAWETDPTLIETSFSQASETPATPNSLAWGPSGR